MVYLMDKVNSNHSAKAWLVQVAKKWVAIGNYELKMLVRDAHIVPVLGAPSHCRDLLIMGDNVFPVLNTEIFFGEKINHNGIFGLVTYTDNKLKKPSYGAICFDGAPQGVEVTDDMEVEMVPEKDNLHQFSRNIFTYNSSRVSVLDLDRIFNITQ